MKYGYPKLGDISNFLRNCVGNDALIALKSKSINKFNKSDKERLLKEWNRLCDETLDEYAKYRFEENELVSLAKEYFIQIQKKYSIPEGIGACLIQFCQNFYNELKKEENNGLVSELETRKYALLSVNQAINLIMLPEYCEKNGIKETKERIRFYLNKDFSYKALFDALLAKTNLLSLNKYIEGLQSTFDSENQAKGEKTSSFHDCITLAYKENKNPTWQRFQFILKYCPQKLQSDFIFAYTLNNIQASLKNNFDLTEEDFSKIKNDLKTFTEQEPKNFNKRINEEIQYYAKDFVCNTTIKEIFTKTFENFEYKKTGIESYSQMLEGIKKECLRASAFFVPWFKAFVCVAQEKYEEARSLFKQAFEYYQFAGDYLSWFLEMAFSFENYFTQWENARKAISGEQNKTPVTKHAKLYWNFGYAIGLFDKKADDTFLEAYAPVLNFYRYFSVNCFIDTDKATERSCKELLSELGIHYSSSNNLPYKKAFAILSALKTSQERNKRISLFLEDTAPENENQKRLYTPLALCMLYGSNDNRLWDLANEWLDDMKNPVDVDKLCFNGSTALHEALTQYAHIRLHSHEITDGQKKLRAVTSKLIDRATYLVETKRQTQIHTLQVAIHSYDVDFVKRIADKISDEEFQNYRISADETSPLYYVLMRRHPLLAEKEKYLKTHKENMESVILKNLAVNGYTEAEKRKSLKQLNQAIQYILPHSHDFIFGFATKDAQLKAFDEIIDYFISRTHDVDSFILYRKDDGSNQGCTALLYAAEFDDAKTCRKLLNAGADVTKQIGLPAIWTKNGGEIKIPNSFIYRLIYYKSWNTLRMFLTDYTEKAHLVMHKGNSDITPLVYFIISVQDALICLEDTVSCDDFSMFIKLFCSAGANLTESTELGCAEFLLSQQ